MKRVRIDLCLLLPVFIFSLVNTVHTAAYQPVSKVIHVKYKEIFFNLNICSTIITTFTRTVISSFQVHENEKDYGYSGAPPMPHEKALKPLEVLC